MSYHHNHEKQHSTVILLPLIALQIGGGAVTGLSIIESILRNLNKIVLEQKINVDVFIFIMMPKIKGEVLQILHDRLIKKPHNIHVHGYVFTTTLDFFAKYVKILYHICKELLSYEKVIVCTPVADVENLLPSILFKLLHPKTVLIVLKHGTAKLILKTYTLKMGFLRKLYTILHATFHLLVDMLHPITLTPIPYLRGHYLKVPYPFDLKVDPLDKVLHNPKNVILFIGRLDHKVKQWHEAIIAYVRFIRKYKKVLKEIPLFVICGDGPDRKIVEEISSRHSKLIKYYGFVAGETKDLIIDQSIVVLLPSRFETYPIILHEALSKLVPVVAYKGFWVQSIPPELINKIVFVVRNVDEMAEVINKILTTGIHIDSALWKTLDKYIKSAFNRKIFESVLIKLLQQLLAT